MYINEVSKSLYWWFSHTPKFGPIFSENTAAYLPVNTVHNNIICSQKITSEVKCKLNKKQTIYSLSLLLHKGHGWYHRLGKTWGQGLHIIQNIGRDTVNPTKE